MALNLVALEGRIPFDLEIKNGDDDKRAFLGFPVSVRRNYKPEGEQYYPEDLLYCKAFGRTAQNIEKFFSKGGSIIIRGEARMDDDYEKDGEVVKGKMYIHVVGFEFLSGNGNGNSGNGNGSDSAPKTSTTKKTSASGGLARKRKKGPLAS